MRIIKIITENVTNSIIDLNVLNAILNDQKIKRAKYFFILAGIDDEEKEMWQYTIGLDKNIKKECLINSEASLLANMPKISTKQLFDVLCKLKPEQWENILLGSDEY